MKIVILLAVSLSWAAAQVSLTDVYLPVLLRSKSGLVTQMVRQIEQTRTVMSSTLNAEFVKFMAAIEGAHQFAVQETAALDEYFVGVSDECLAGAPTTVPEILVTADDYLGQCVSSLVGQSDEIVANYLNLIEGYRSSANDLNLLFARDYFKSPAEVFTWDMYVEAAEAIRRTAIQWDNVGSVTLYRTRAEARDQLEAINQSLFKCIMDMKEFVATELGFVYLYLWTC